MVNNYFHLKEGQLPPLHSGPSPSFHHSKKRKTSHSTSEESSLGVVWRERKNENKMRRKDRAKTLYISYYGNLQVFNEKHTYISPSLSLLIYKLPKKYIKIYKRKYLGWLQGETRKLHKLSEDKNLTESVHREILHTMRNLAWCAKFRTTM